MKAKDLLSELRDNILRDRSTAVRPSAEDNLWSDAALMRYINEGYNRFARKALAIRDASTPEVTQLTLQSGVASYPLDRRVVEVYHGEVNGTEVVSSSHPSTRGWPAAVALQPARNAVVAPGRPRLFVVDETNRTLRLVPAPNADFAGATLQLTVARLPMKPLTLAENNEPEIDEDFHLELLEWAAWRALRNHDVDGENMAKASAHKTQFNAAVDDYKRHMKRLLRRPVQFGLRGARSSGNC